MKYLATTLVLLYLGSMALAQSRANIGMTMNEVKNIYPGMESTNYQNTITLSRAEDLYGLDGNWGYRFEGDKLNWIFFNKYIDKINDKNFQKCLTAAKQIIIDFTKVYGNPDTTITGNTKFIDPYKDKHWGYKVLEARWSNYNGMKIKVEFTFMGSKGLYNFLVKINYFDRSYTYYD
jgi:hypothetical protein